MRCANRTAPVRGGSRGGGARVRVPRLPVWPRRLRWRLVLGFALSVALVEAGLVGVERALLEKVLVLSTQDSLEATVRAGLAGQALAGQTCVRQHLYPGEQVDQGDGARRGQPPAWPGALQGEGRGNS